MTGAGWLTGAAGSGVSHSAGFTRRTRRICAVGISASSMNDIDEAGAGSTTGSGSTTGLGSTTTMGSGSATGSGSGSTTGSGIRMSAWRTFGISIVSGASTALGGQRHGRDGRLGHRNRCLLCRRCFFGGRNRLRNMRVADRLTLRTPAWERRLSVGHRLSLRGLARTTTKRGIRGRNRGRGALRSVSHWGLEGAAGYASGRHRLTGDRLGRALGEDHRPVVLA